MTEAQVLSQLRLQLPILFFLLLGLLVDGARLTSCFGHLLVFPTSNFGFCCKVNTC